MKTVAVVQARTGSSRLPGKVLKPLAGKPMLEQLLARLSRSKRIDEVMVATTVCAKDDAIVELVGRCSGVGLCRGSENDVLARYQMAAASSKADTLVRITADCPLMDPLLVDQLVEFFQTKHPDYASNCQSRTFARGFDIEVFSAAALREAFLEAKAPFEREHVTPFIWQRPSRYRLESFVDSEDRGALRLTVDTEEDYELVRRVFEAAHQANPDFTYRDVVGILAAHPEWCELNRHVRQKELTA